MWRLRIARAGQGLALTLIAAITASAASAQTLPLDVLEPGARYQRVRQWAVQSRLMFENFSRNSLLMRDSDLSAIPPTYIQVQFCGGEDYDGRASTIRVQQHFSADQIGRVLRLQREYIQRLSGSPNADAQFPGAFRMRRERRDADGWEGVAVGVDDPQAGSWEVGLFEKTLSGRSVLLLQVSRRRESVCS